VALASAIVLSTGMPAALAQPQHNSAPPHATVLTDQNSKNVRLLAAAEPFEGLTEQSFSAKPKDLDRMVRNAHKAADRVAAILPAQEHSALTQELKKIGDAKAK